MKKTKAIRILPLGGLGEIGMNMMMIQVGSSAIIVDCGVMFADNHLPGVDLIVPDFSYFKRERVDVRGLFLTHGHEDHIGAVPFFLRQVQTPVYGSRFTLALVKERLRDHELESGVELNLVKEGDRIQRSPFTIECIQVSHSIADALALHIETPAGSIIHTGDFKIDPKPADGRITDLEKFRSFGDKGVKLLLSDSTNVEVPGSSVSESTVYEGIKDIIDETPGWVVLASFASHIPRIKQVMEVALHSGRKILVAGRSMITNVDIARNLGHLAIPDDLLIGLEDVRTIPRDKLIILSTGTQGEPRSALARMAFDQYKELRITPGDRVILSSRFIPGNEREIYNIVNHLYRRGAEVFTTRGDRVHVSGHGYRGDLEQMLRAVRPEYFVPVHGEYRHLVKHAQLAQETGVRKENTVVIEDGDIVEFSKGPAKIVDRIDLNRSVVDGRELADIGSIVLRDRRHLAETGLVVVVVIIDSHTGEVVRGPEVFSRGAVFEPEAESLLNETQKIVRKTIDHFGSEARTDDYGLQEEIRLAVRRFFRNRLDRKPVVIPIVMEV